MALLRRIIPHLGTGLKAALLCNHASADPEGECAPGVLVLDDRGRVVQHTQAAERWLRDLDDLADGWLEGEGLPAPVWMVVGALRKALKPETDRGLGGVPSVRVQTSSGRWLTGVTLAYQRLQTGRNAAEPADSEDSSGPGAERTAGLLLLSYYLPALVWALKRGRRKYLLYSAPFATTLCAALKGRSTGL